MTLFNFHRVMTMAMNWRENHPFKVRISLCSKMGFFKLSTLQFRFGTTEIEQGKRGGLTPTKAKLVQIVKAVGDKFQYICGAHTMASGMFIAV